MKKWKLGLSLVITASILAACGGSNGKDTAATKESDTNKSANVAQVLRASVPAEITTLDTTKATDRNTFTVIEQIFEGLYRFNGDNELELALAKEPAKISDDGLTYTFKLKEDAK